MVTPADVNDDGEVNADDESEFSKSYDADAERSTIGPGAWGPCVLRIGFCGYVQDFNYQTHWLARNRWYESDQGRWLTRDPAGYIDGLSMYMYVRCNPFGLVDPMGLAPDWPGPSAALEWATGEIDRANQRISDAGYPGVAKAASLFSGLQLGAMRNVVGCIDGGYQLGAEGVCTQARHVGLMSSETYSDHSLTANTVDAVQQQGVSGVVEGAWSGVKEHIGRELSGDLDAIGDTSFGIGTSLLSTSKISWLNKVLSKGKILDKADDAAKATVATGKAAPTAAAVESGVAGETVAPAKGVTYKLRDPETREVRRTGQSNDLDRREKEHARSEKTKNLIFEVDRRSDDLAARLGREQRIYDEHPEADLNKRRSIGLKNKRRDEYLKKGDKL